MGSILKRALACLLATLLLLPVLPAGALGEGEATGGIDFDASNVTTSRLLYGSMFYIDWTPGTGLTGWTDPTPGRDCSGAAANGANPDMVLEMTVTFSAIDGTSDPATCWEQIRLRLRSSQVDGQELASEFYDIFRSAYGDSETVNVQIPLSAFGAGSIDWADTKELIIQIPVAEDYQLGAEGDSPAIQVSISGARIVDYANMAARQQLRQFLADTAGYRYTADEAAAAYEQIRQEAQALLDTYAAEDAYAAMCDRLTAAIGQLSGLRDVTERAADLAGPDSPAAPQDGVVTMELTGSAGLSLHAPGSLYLSWEGEAATDVTGGSAVLHTDEGDVTVPFDALQSLTQNGHTRFYLPLPAVGGLTGVTLTMQTAGEFRLTDAFIGDITQHTEQAALLQPLTEETVDLYTPQAALAEDHAAAAATARGLLEQGVFASGEELKAARASLLALRHAWREVSGGDLNDDMLIAASDALLALQAATGKITLEDTDMADIDKQDGVTASDALQILQYATKKITAFPGGGETTGANSVLHAQQAGGGYEAAADSLAPDAASVGFTQPGGYIAYRGVDFGEGENTTFMAVLSSGKEAVGKALQVRLDSPAGDLIASLTLTGGDETVFAEQYASLTQAVTGVHDVYLTAPDAAGVHIDWCIFSPYTGEETAEEKEERMAWWNDARFGMFIHWGAYANFPFDETGPAPGYTEWVQGDLKISKEDYEQMAVAGFNPQSWDANAIVKLAQEAGQKYIVFTSKHHEGFSMFDTQVTGFKDWSLTGYGVYQGPDPLKELAEASREAGIPFGCYYSTMDWHHDATVNWGSMLDKPHYVADMKAQLRELIENYDVDILWFDGEWVDWWTTQDGQDLYRYLRTIKPSLILNNRIGKRAATDGDFGTPEQEIPANGLDYDWESCITMNGNWGYAPYDENWKSPTWIVQSVVDTASKGGNILLNVGPDAQGVVPEQCAENMRTAGEWFAAYGDSIYSTTASPFAEALSFGAATKKDGVLYLHVTNWPQNGQITLPALKNTVTGVQVMGTDTPLAYAVNGDTMTITLPDTAPNAMDTVIEVLVEGVPQPAATYTYSQNYALNKPATVSNYYQNDAQYNGAAAVDGNTSTRWATDDNVTECWLEVDLGEETSFNAIQCSEFTDTGGQRVTAYRVEYWDGSEWQTAHAGTSIGSRHTAVFDTVTSQRVRLHILEIDPAAQGGPSIWEFGVYTATRQE